jgi:rhodanese-related sulfurtransferase
MQVPEIDAQELSGWLKNGRKVSIVDIRPATARSKSLIAESIHVNVYDKIKRHDENAFKCLHLDKSVPVVAVCGGGTASILAAEILITDGYKAYSLLGGMTGWELFNKGI